MYTIYLTTECNFACTYCYESFCDVKAMTWDRLKQIVDYIFTTDTNSKIIISFMGGEPLLKKELIIDAVEYIERHYKKECSYHITTNCSLLDEKMLDFMKLHKFKIRASFDGIKEVHNMNRIPKNNKDVYERILENILRMKEKGMDFLIRGTIAENTISYLTENVKFFHELGINQISMIPDVNMIMSESNKRLFDQEMAKLKEYYIAEFKEGRKFGIDIFDGHFLNFLVGNQNRFCMCGAGLNSYTIMPDMNVYPCAYVTDKKDFCIGKIPEGIDRNKSLQLVKRYYSIDEEKCKDCTIKMFCLGMKCGYLNYIKSSYINVPSDMTCFQENIFYKYVKEIMDVFLFERKENISFLDSLIRFIEGDGVELNEYGEAFKKKFQK